MSNEVHTLRKANEALSKRRKAKKTRLRLGEAMIVSSAKDELDQKAVDEQLEREERENLGCKKGEEVGKRYCRNCGKAGHNIRTRQNDREVVDLADLE